MWRPPADCHAAALAYRELLGWPAFAQHPIVWMTPGVVADALNVPAQTGLRALDHLLRIDVDLPVVHMPGPPDRVALLARPGDEPPRTIAALFTGHDVGHAHGRHIQGRASQWGIDLPPTRHPGCAPLTWLRPPTTPLPTLRLVTQAVLNTLADGTRP